MGSIAREAGDSARLASCIGAKEVGRVPRPTAAWAAADLVRMPSADCADGTRESWLGLLPDSRRTPDAWLSGRCDHDPLGSAGGRRSAFAPTIPDDVEAVPDRARRNPWLRLTSSAWTRSSSSASTSRHLQTVI